jgi:hypothetical protein
VSGGGSAVRAVAPPAAWGERFVRSRGRNRLQQRTNPCLAGMWHWGGRAGSEIGTNPGTPSPSLSVIPPRCSSEPERLDGASPQTRMGQGMDRVVGVDVSKGQLDACDLDEGRRLAVGNDAAGIARLGAWASPGALVVRRHRGATSAWRIGACSSAASRSRSSTPSGCATAPGRADDWPKPTGSMPR